MKRYMLASAAVAVVVFVAVTAWAGVRATVLLKSGDRVTGEVIDLNASGLVVGVNNGQRAIPIGEVAIIDFEGGADVPSTRVGGGRLVLRGGQVVDGRLVDIGGTDPLRVTFDTPSGQRDYRSDEISRIYVSDPPDQQPPTAPPAPPGSITVRGDQVWTPTGIFVRRGQRVSFQASGEVRLSGSENDVATVTGSRLGRYAQRSPLPMTFAGALIGRVGNGEPFGIGSQTQPLAMPGDGQLYLGVNDDVASDNTGEFYVTVRGGQRGTQPRR